ncbi:Redoxin domain-containing protein [Rhodopirellula maiorica SM1]|uniref:Redoxin domain-containing protein n=2 Tax=Novipirellula TaxID=2795426 RepID=M5R7C2_9BACT|nr:Redoxin domain-containing protein [Rhodopirellula maiorica SM1]
MQKFMKRFILLNLLIGLSLSLTNVPTLFAQTAKENAGKTADAKDSDPPAVEDQDADADQDAEEQTIEPLTIGSIAPELDIEHWIHDGNGAFDAVTKFEKNKVYVVEFWATWCGPCISAMPHVVALQKEYADRGVQIVSVSSEPVETIEKFLEREVPGAKGSDDSAQTFDDLTRSYCLTTDPDRSTSKSYMEAAGQNGIPCAFLIGKSGLVEWIGHPMSMDEPLAKVVNDDWDRQAFAEEFKEEQRADMVFKAFVSAMRSNNTDKALEILDGYIAEGKLAARVSQMQMVKMQVLASDDSRADELTAYVNHLLQDESFDAEAVNRLGWTIARYATAGKIDDEVTVRAALQKTQSILADAGESKPFVMDTIAHLQFALGDKAAAIATQTEAVELAEESHKPRLQRFLDELTAELATDGESAEESSPEKPAESS